MACNEADGARLARLIGKKMAIKIKYITRKMLRECFLRKILFIAET